jgi:hypothetical protein
MRRRKEIGGNVRNLSIAMVAVVLFMMATAATQASQHVRSDPEPVIEIHDVERFYELYDEMEGHPTADVLQHRYIEAGSDGLRTLARLRNVTGQAIADAIAKKPDMYAKTRECIEALPRARMRLSRALQELRNAYPEARFPPITIAIGKGKPVGVGGRDTGVQIGAEALCANAWINPDSEDRFVRVIAHEFAHVQQRVSFSESENATVLSASLEEGAAEFVSELTTGAVAYAYMSGLIAGRENEIETAFVADMDKTDLSQWLYNSTPERPGDLGYWVGYRIVKSYYQRADDKRQALRDIFEMTDPKAFLARSGWRPGMALD